MNDMDKLIQAAQEGVELIVKTHPDQDLMPTIFVEIEEEIKIIGIVTENKQQNIDAIHSILDKFNPKRYVLIVEGYGTQFSEAAARVNYRISDMAPEDRFDIACLTGVEKGQKAKGLTSIIDRVGDERVLRDWETSTLIDGDYVILNW